jgi:hypothetical protein
LAVQRLFGKGAMRLRTGRSGSGIGLSNHMLLFVVPSEVYAQQPGQGQSPQKIGVKIIIDVTPEGFRDEVTSYYLRELRSLGDVTIVE